MTTLASDTAFSDRRADSVTINSASTATQVIRIPWANPANKKARIKKVQSTTTMLSGQILMFWDADLSNTTPVTRGTGTIGGSYFNLAIPPVSSTLSGMVAGTAVWTEDQLPAYEFEAGVAVAVIGTNATQVGVEIEEF